MSLKTFGRHGRLSQGGIMKLKNKKTGEIGNLVNRGLEDERIWVWIDNISKPEYRYNSLAELNEEWEDYEEAKEYWYIDYDGGILCGETDNSSTEKMMISIGNQFETLEEAEKAVEKLKAYKRLKEKGFRFTGWNRRYCDEINYQLDTTEDMSKDLDLLFGGGE